MIHFNAIMPIYKDKEHPDHLFIHKLINKFFLSAILKVIFLAYAISKVFSANPNKVFDMMLGLVFAIRALIEIVFSFLLIDAYLKLREDSDYKPKFLSSWMERRFWKFYNRSKYGWKFMGVYSKNKTYSQGAYHAKNNTYLGEDLMASVGPAMRMTKAVVDPFYKKQFKFKFDNMIVFINGLNKKAGKNIIMPDKNAHLDDFAKYQYQTSAAYHEEGEREFERGFYDQYDSDQYDL